MSAWSTIPAKAPVLAIAVALLALAANLAGDLINRRIDERTNR